MPTQGSTTYVVCSYPGMATSEMRSKLRLRTRHPGLNNRMDVLEIFTYDRLDGAKSRIPGVIACTVLSSAGPPMYTLRSLTDAEGTQLWST
jgi:F-box only protein C-terminal region